MIEELACSFLNFHSFGWKNRFIKKYATNQMSKFCQKKPNDCQKILDQYRECIDHKNALIREHRRMCVENAIRSFAELGIFSDLPINKTSVL